MTQVVGPDRSASQEIAHAIRLRAAVVGAFNPRTLVPGGIDDRTARHALALLATDCEEVKRDTQVLWLLKPDLRRQTIAELQQAVAGGGADWQALTAATPAPEADSLGRFLQTALRGAAPSPEGLDIPKLGDLHTALEFAAPVNNDQGSIHAVRRQMARRQQEESLNFLLPRSLYGREREMDALRQFIATGEVASEFRLPGGDVQQPPAARPRGLLITGIGGVGKSALLAKFVREARLVDWTGTIVVALDFDRPALSKVDPAALTFELTRQLGLARDELDDPMSRVRDQLRGLQQSLGFEAQGNFDATQRLVSSAWSHLRHVAVSTGLSPQPIAVLLDTLEEVLVGDVERTAYVFQWLEGLKNEAGFDNLRVLVGGRAAPDEAVPQLKDWFSGHIRLGDLDANAASAVLAEHRVPSGLARELAVAFGGNPLVLRILAQFYERHGRAETLSLLKETSGRERFAGEMAQRFLYGRILERIGDEKVRNLAHPGLVLRRVTPGLIQQVLAGPCDLGALDDDAALDLFNRLANQVWLVSPSGFRAVMHRRDLRRLMLRQTLADKDAKKIAQVAGIGRNAVTYYRAGRDPQMSAREQLVEATYHALLLGQTPKLSTAIAAEVAASIGGDIDDLPGAARAALEAQAGRSLSAAQIALLPAGFRARAVTKRRQEQLSRGQAAGVLIDEEAAESARFFVGSAIDRPRRAARRKSTQEPGDEAVPPSAEWIQAAFIEGRFREVTDSWMPVFDEFAIRVVEPGRRIEDRGWNEAQIGYPIWLVAMASLLHPLPGDLLRAWARRRVFDAAPVHPAASLADAGAASLLLMVSALKLMSRGQRRRWSELDEMAGRLLSGLEPEPIRSTYHLRVLSLHLPELVKAGVDVSSMSVELRFLPVLSRAVLETPMRSRSNEAVRPVHAGLQTLRRLSSQPRLAELDAAASRVTRLNLSMRVLRQWLGPAGLGDLLLGSAPELHGPARSALRAAFANPEDVARLVADVAAKAALWPVELLPERFAAAVERDPDRWFATLVEVSDRAGLLHYLLAAGHRHAPGASRVTDVARLFERQRGVLQSSLRFWKQGNEEG